MHTQDTETWETVKPRSTRRVTKIDMPGLERTVHVQKHVSQVRRDVKNRTHPARALAKHDVLVVNSDEEGNIDSYTMTVYDIVEYPGHGTLNLKGDLYVGEFTYKSSFQVADVLRGTPVSTRLLPGKHGNVLVTVSTPYGTETRVVDARFHSSIEHMIASGIE